VLLIVPATEGRGKQDVGEEELDGVTELRAQHRREGVGGMVLLMEVLVEIRGVQEAMGEHDIL
jgi:hypothetical protein